jgi:predicted Zn finger-like uncharacterized protein
MIITCEFCNAKYEVNDDLVKPEGTKARCSACNKVFTAYPQSQSLNVDITSDFEDGIGDMIDDFEEHTVSAVPDDDDTNEIDMDRLEQTTGFEDDIEDMTDTFEEETSFELTEDEDTAEVDMESLVLTSDFEDDIEDMIDEFEEETDFATTREGETGDMDMDRLENTSVIGYTDIEKQTSSPETFESETAFDDDLGIEQELEDFDLNLEETDEESTQTLEAEKDALDEFELEFDVDPDAPTGEFEIDLEESSESMETEEFGLDLEVDETLQGSEEDFSSELDFELEEKTAGKTASEASDIDFTEKTLELDLDEDDEKTVEAMIDDDDDFDLDFDLDMGDETDAKETIGEATPQSVDEDEFDLTDVEDFLDLEEKTEDSVALVDDDDDFDLQLATGDVTSAASADKDFDIDLETVNDDAGIMDDETMEPVMESHRTATAEMAAETVREQTSREDETFFDPQDEKEVSRLGAPGSGIPVTPEKKSSLKTLLIILILLAIAGGIYFYMMQEEEAAVPVSSVTVPADPHGNLQMAISRPDYMFVSNETAGELMVVSGSVTNRYEAVRRQVQVRGNLYNGAGDLLQSSTAVYAGVVFDISDITTMSLAEINGGLTQPGTAELDIEVRPNQSIPFQFVFSMLPGDAQEMNVEVVGSAPGI